MSTTLDRDELAYRKWLTDLNNREVFRYAANSYQGSTFMTGGRNWMKQRDKQTCVLMSVLGKLGQRYESLMPVCLAIVRGVNPHAARGEWCAQIFEIARQELGKIYENVEKRSGPGHYRPSECKRRYNDFEKFVVFHVLSSLTDDWMGLGWCAQRFAKENNIPLRNQRDCFGKELKSLEVSF